MRNLEITAGVAETCVEVFFLTDIIIRVGVVMHLFHTRHK
jgi:hypothetical protein